MAFGDVMNKLFGSGPAQPQVQQVQIIPNNNPSGVANPGMPLPGSDPTNPTIPLQVPSPNTDPMAEFAKLWETPSIDPNAPPDSGNYFAKLDPAKVMESAKKVNFANQVISPELMQQIAAGGESAVKAMMSLVNQSSQQVYGQSAIATASIVEKALAKQREQFQQQLPGILKSQLVSDSLATENPIFSNPALAPMVDMARTQVLQKFPNATQAEVKTQVVNFFNAMQSALAPKPVKSAAEKAAEETDWSKYFPED